VRRLPAAVEVRVPVVAAAGRSIIPGRQPYHHVRSGSVNNVNVDRNVNVDVDGG